MPVARMLIAALALLIVIIAPTAGATGHPVDIATGRVFTDRTDVDLPGDLPLKIERVYNSGFADRDGPLGHGWGHSLDSRLWQERGKVVYQSDDGRELEFDAMHLPKHRMAIGDELYHGVDKLTLKVSPLRTT